MKRLLAILVTLDDRDLVVVDQVNVVGRVPPVLEPVHAAIAADGIGMGAEDPVGDIDLMAGEKDFGGRAGLSDTSGREPRHRPRGLLRCAA